MTGFWREIADGVFSHAFEPFDVNSYAVVGSGGVLLVDSGNSPVQCQQLLDESAGLAARLALTPSPVESHRPVVALVNTHAHYDHCFGNVAAWLSGVPVIAHAGFSAHLATHGRQELEKYRAGDLAPEIVPGLWDNVELSAPDVSIAEPTRGLSIPALAGFGRELELLPFAPAHTTCDLVVRVNDADVWLVGDLIETSGPPQAEVDSDLEGWVSGLDRILNACGPDALILPGHGDPASRSQATQQRQVITNALATSQGISPGN